MNILLVKLSSLGDVLHNLPIVWDIRTNYPDARLDWVVEEGYVELLTPLKTTDSFKGIDHIIPISLRRWKKNLKNGELIKPIQEFIACKNALQEVSYDIVIETQGLIKSALVTKFVKKSPNAIVAGLANQTEYSGYEPFARRFYTECVQVPTQCHAVDRSRWVTAAALDAPIPDRVDQAPHFYTTSYVEQLTTQLNPLDLAAGSYVMCFHATARAAKQWMPERWIAVAKELSAKGFTVIFPWGNEVEKRASEYLASKVPNALVPRAFSVAESFPLIAQAKLTIGVDTGFTHLSAILGKPTIELYVDSPRWKTEGYWSDRIINLGDMKQAPSQVEVIAALNRLLEN